MWKQYKRYGTPSVLTELMDLLVTVQVISSLLVYSVVVVSIEGITLNTLFLRESFPKGNHRFIRIPIFQLSALNFVLIFLRHSG